MSCLVYLDTLDLGFCFDDHSAIVSNEDLKPGSPWSNLLFDDFWGTPMNVEGSHKSYRPLCVLTFRLNYFLHALQPYGYHFVNVILHAAVTFLFVRVCRSVVECSDVVCFVAGALFAVHPIHTEAVAGVVGRAESLSAVFFLLCLLAYKQCCKEDNKTNYNWLLTSLLLCVATVLCKEQGVTVVAVCLVYDVFLARKLNLSRCIGLLRDTLTGKAFSHPWFPSLIVRVVAVVIFFVGVMAARLRIMAAALPTFVIHDNPALGAPTPTRQLTWLHLCFVNVWLLLTPSKLCPDWTMQTVPLVETVFDPRNLATLTVFAAVLALGLYGVLGQHREHKAVLMGLSLIIFPYVPASNLFFPVGFVVAERILYIPSMGFSLLVAVGVSRLMNYKYFKQVTTAGLLYLLIVHSAKTVIRNRDWESDITLFTSAIKVNGNNGKLYNNLGHQYENMKNFTYAEELFRRGSEIQPDDVGSHMNLGRVLKAMGRLPEAEQAYRTGISMLPDFKKTKKARMAPNHINIYYNLANLLREDAAGLQEADELYALAIKMKKDFVDAYINRADVLLKLNRSEDALKSYEQALKYSPQNLMALFNLGTYYLQLGNKAEAEKYYRQTLQVDPSYRMALGNLAHLLAESKEPNKLKETIQLFEKALELDPTDITSMSSIALAYGDLGQDEKALTWLGRVIEADPSLRSPQYNTAVILNRNKRYMEAIPYIQQLLKYHPSYIKGYHLMGESLFALKRYKEALEFYQKALQLNAQDHMALFNMAIVYTELGMLEQAEKSLVSLSRLAPNDPNIKERLQRVRSKMKEKD